MNARPITLLAALLALALVTPPSYGQNDDTPPQDMPKPASKPPSAPDDGGAAKPSPLYGEVDALNAGLPATRNPPDLSTPQSALEHYMTACERKDYLRAARVLNLNGIPLNRQAADGPKLARQFRTVMKQQIWFNWSDVPDRPDGEDDDYKMEEGQSHGPTGPRQNIRIYRLTIGDHDYEIRLERIKPRGGEPVWVFSRQTVAHIPLLYREFSPGRVENAMPEVLKRREILHIALWQWLGFLIILLAGAALGWMVQFGLNRLLRQFDTTWSHAAAQAIRGPGAVAVGVWIVYVLIKDYLALAGPVLSRLEPVLFAAIAAGLIWFVQRLIHVLTGLISHRYESYNSDEANILLTRISVVRHLLMFTVFTGGVILVLGRFEWFRNIGMSLLASAGIAGLVLGIAAHRMLGNLFAGLLLAVTQPVKTGDAIIFEGTFGWIEEIAITYIVIRSWDLRRLVVPTAYFLDHPFENWSRGPHQLIKPVILHADYRVDVDALREALGGILEETDLWDRSMPPVLQIVDFHPGTVEIRALCSARDPGSAWDLQCHIRERLLTTLRDLDNGRYLPRERVMLVDRDGEERKPEEQTANWRTAEESL